VEKPADRRWPKKSDVFEANLADTPLGGGPVIVQNEPSSKCETRPFSKLGRVSFGGLTARNFGRPDYLPGMRQHIFQPCIPTRSAKVPTGCTKSSKTEYVGRSRVFLMCVPVHKV
jgi:hypothetical protein